MSAEYAFDLYPRDDPRDGTRLVRYTYEDLIAAEYRDVIGVGSGQATMWANHAGAEFVDVRGEQYVRVVRLGGVDAVVGGIWTSKLPFETAVASERRHLTISGPGQMAYLARARMAPHTYIHDLFIGQDPFDGMWRLYAQGLGNTLGAILYRVIYEAQHFRNTATYTHEHGDGLLYTDSHADDRLTSRIPDLVMGFDNDVDSNGNAWTLVSGDLTAQVGENVLGVVQRLMQAGLSLWMDPDDFTLYAWEGRPATKLGRSTDRTGVAWGADVVRFQYPTDGTLATGNVLSETTRIVNSYLPQGPIWVGGNDIYHLETGPADALYEGFIPSGVDDLTALANIGAAQSTAKVEASDVGQVKHRLGDDETNGAYLPGEHYRLDELVRVNTGTGEFDYSEDNYPVGAWRVSLPENSAEWEAYADLGASYDEAQRREFAVPSTAGHTHPPNPPLCPPTDLLRGITALKGSGAQVTPAAPLTNANDGDDSTPWGSGEGEPSIGVAGEWWAADLGSPEMVGVYRIRQQGGAAPNVQNVATTVGIYGATAASLWTALPASGKLTDPEALGWRLLATYTGALAYSDVGAAFTPVGARYVIFWAEAGGTLDWDVETFSLWSYVGTDPYAAHCGHEHPAATIDFTPTGTIAATNVQDAIAEVASEAGATLTVEDEGTPLATAATTLDFVGAGVTATGAGAQKTITIPGGSGDITFDELEWFNVEDYGAVHDGVTDDRSSIQDALDACFAAGGGTVYFPIGTYYLGATLQDTGTYNSLLKIPQTTGTGYGLRFLGEKSTLMTDWAGTITGTPSVISAGTHDSHTLNEVFIRFERMRIQVPLNPKLSGIDATKAITVRWNDLLIYTGSNPASVPTNTNAIAIDLPWGLNDQNSGGDGLYIVGFYTGIRPSEQMIADAIYVAFCARAAEFRGSGGSPDYLAHAASIQRLNVWFCVRGLVFTGDERTVHIALMDVEHDDPDFVIVYDIDDASNYGRGFVGWHTTDYDTGEPVDDLLVNGGTGLSLHGGHAKRWRLANVVDIPTGTNPSTNPANGRRMYADSTSGNLTVRKPDGSTVDLEAAALGAWTTFSPTFSTSGGGGAIGNGTLLGRYKELDGSTVAVSIVLVWGSTSTVGTGNFQIGNFPFTVKSTNPTIQVLPGVVIDSGTASFVAMGRCTQGATACNLIVVADATGTRHAADTIPVTWATGDQIILNGVLETD